MRSFRSKSVFEALESRRCLAAEVIGWRSEFEAPAETSKVMLAPLVVDDAIVNPMLDDALLGDPLGDAPLVDAQIPDDASIEETWKDTSDLQSGGTVEQKDCAKTAELSELFLGELACSDDSSPLGPGDTSTETTFRFAGISAADALPSLPIEQPGGTELIGGTELPGAEVLLNPPATEEQGVEPRPQIWPAPPITITATAPLPSRSIETMTSIPLRDISEFLSNHRANAKSDFEISRRDRAMVQVERVSTQLPNNRDVLASQWCTTESERSIASGQVRPRVVGVTQLMPMVSTRPRQSASNDTTAGSSDNLRPVRKTIDSRNSDSASVMPIIMDVAGAVELVNASGSNMSTVENGRLATHLLAILPEDADVDAMLAADETAMHHRPNSMLGIAIATVFGLPQAFIRPWRIRQRERVTTKPNLDQYQ